MIYVERIRDGKVLNSFGCKTIPEAKRVVACMAGLLADGETLRTVKGETLRIVEEVQL